MFSTVINALKVKDIRHKIFFTLGILIVFRLGSYITVPGVNAHALQSISSSGLVGILNTFSGGGLTNYSIFAMGVSPYITAQIIVQLLQMDIVPKFVEWSKQGEVGRRKLNQATRWLTIVLAFAQSIGITAGFNYLSQMNLVETPNLLNHRVDFNSGNDVNNLVRRYDYRTGYWSRGFNDHLRRDHCPDTNWNSTNLY